MGGTPKTALPPQDRAASLDSDFNCETSARDSFSFFSVSAILSNWL
ncbi:MAG: hypothetical protein F6K65_20850 [Moorea sp. SIO3C2]|nr:hypothetical protein [Moorena sp. SIO3C2]